MERLSRCLGHGGLYDKSRRNKGSVQEGYNISAEERLRRIRSYAAGSLAGTEKARKEHPEKTIKRCYLRSAYMVLLKQNYTKVKRISLRYRLTTNRLCYEGKIPSSP